MIANPPGRLTENGHIRRSGISGATGCKSPEHKVVRSFFDGGLQIRLDA